MAKSTQVFCRKISCAGWLLIAIVINLAAQASAITRSVFFPYLRLSY